MSKRRPTREDTALGERLKLARIRLHLTQRQAGKRLGKSQTFVAASESGQRVVKAIDMPGFAKAYRQPLTFFLPPSR